MKRLVFGLVVGMGIVASLCIVPSCAYSQKPVPIGVPTPCPAGVGWVDLLDADHAAGWTNITDEDEIFVLEGRVLHLLGKSIGKLRYAGYTPERFGDFDLHLEFKLAKGANSGLFLRVQPGDKQYRGFEVQILDDHGEAPSKNASGAIYDITTPMYNMALPAGEWNSYDLSLRGGEVIVYVNGWRVVHTDLSQMTMPIGKFDFPFATYPADGLIALQDHGGEAWFRNIMIKKKQP